MSNTNLLVDDYYNWLMDIIEEDKHPTSNYSYVLDKMFHTEFYGIVGNDCNRLEDGFELRSIFANEIGEHLYYVMDELPDFCSVLEMMIGLAKRWEDDVTYIPGEYGHEAMWFWQMMDNLGLSKITDDEFDDGVVEDILFRFLERKYERNGKGGLFYIPNCHEDMRKIEIWYQMNRYFDELYGC